MKTTILFFHCFIFSIAFSYAQDTIRIGKPIHYTSAQFPQRGKAFADFVKYAREDIEFSPTHKKIEYCYYYNTERVCMETNYKILDDSVLYVNDDKWIFRKQKDSFFVYRYYNKLYESGYAKSLIPFETISPFITLCADKTDTLWITDYRFDKPDNPFDFPKYQLPHTKVDGKVYDAHKTDMPPLFLNDTPFEELSLTRTDFCYGEPAFRKSFIINFTVTKDGKIVNILDGMNNYDFSCPPLLIDILKVIYQEPIIKPARIKNKAVNTKWAVRIIQT